MCRLSDAELNCVSTKMRRMSACRQLLIGMSISRYWPAIGTAGFDRSCVSGKSRVPWPPPRMIARTSLFTNIGVQCSPANRYAPEPDLSVRTLFSRQFDREQAPPPGEFSTRTLPPWSSTRCLTIANPRPVPRDRVRATCPRGRSARRFAPGPHPGFPALDRRLRSKRTRPAADVHVNQAVARRSIGARIGDQVAQRIVQLRGIAFDRCRVLVIVTSIRWRRCSSGTARIGRSPSAIRPPTSHDISSSRLLAAHRGVRGGAGPSPGAPSAGYGA